MNTLKLQPFAQRNHDRKQVPFVAWIEEVPFAVTITKRSARAGRSSLEWNYFATMVRSLLARRAGAVDAGPGRRRRNGCLHRRIAARPDDPQLLWENAISKPRTTLAHKPQGSEPKDEE